MLTSNLSVISNENRSIPGFDEDRQGLARFGEVWRGSTVTSAKGLV